MIYNQFLSKYKISAKNKKKSFEHPYIKKLEPIIKKLIELNVLSYAKYNKETKKWTIGLSYINNELTYQNVKPLYKISNRFKVNIKTLKNIKQYKSSHAYILFTTKGILTNLEALNHKIGGILICQLF